MTILYWSRNGWRVREISIVKQFKEVVKVARGRTIKFSPKRGKLTRSQAKRAVEKVILRQRRWQKDDIFKRTQIAGNDFQSWS